MFLYTTGTRGSTSRYTDAALCLFELQVRLLEHQTQRLDEFEKESQAAQERHEETLRRLDRILEKLTDRLN